MKKLCLLLSILMMFCMLGSVSVYAAGTTDAAITLVADKAVVGVGETVVITVGIKGDTAGQGIQGTAKIVPQWDGEYFEFVEAEADSTTFALTNATAVATNYAMTKYQVTFTQKVAAGEDLPVGDYVFGTFTLKALKETDATNISLNTSTAVNVNIDASASVATRATVAEDTVATIKIGADEPEEEVFEITSTGTALDANDTMKDKDGKDVVAAGDKVIAIFAKNVSDAEIAAGSYGIVFGGVRYAGQAAVPAKTAWAIKLVGSADQLPAGSYSYSIFSGDAVVEATAPWVID